MLKVVLEIKFCTIKVKAWHIVRHQMFIIIILCLGTALSPTLGEWLSVHLFWEALSSARQGGGQGAEVSNSAPHRLETPEGL